MAHRFHRSNRAPCTWPAPRGRRGESGQATPRTKGTHVNYQMKKHRKEGTGGFDLSSSAPHTCPWATNLSTFWRASNIAMIAAFFFSLHLYSSLLILRPRAHCTLHRKANEPGHFTLRLSRREPQERAKPPTDLADAGRHESVSSLIGGSKNVLSDSGAL